MEEQNKSIHLSDEEYNTHISTLEFFDTTRNSLLTFAFTTVLALVGAIIALDNPISPYFCLFPYFLIIPFTARITYYRLSSAHINAFLRSYAPEKAIFKRGSTIVREKHNWVYTFIAWFVNHEMFILSIAVGIIYAYQYQATNDINSFGSIVKLLIPLPFIIFDYIITHSTNSYPKLLSHYQEQWDEYKATGKVSIKQKGKATRIKRKRKNEK